MPTNRIRRITAASALAALPLVGAFGLAASASADPANAKNSLTLTVVCDNGSTYTAVTNGSGNWTPAHDLNSTATLIPLTFGTQTFTVRDQNGNVVDQETTPPADKGNAANHDRGTEANCTFSGSNTDPESGFTFTITGSVLGLITPSS